MYLKNITDDFFFFFGSELGDKSEDAMKVINQFTQ